ncbi:MAG: amino acid permease, partial [Candidatus Hydrogenedentes bacterium]|nr:amino acid permease [Candidatus Hydrogenedentota bacterium]
MSLSLDKHQNPGNAFSTFRGVFIPCILTIFGAIMYLRLSLVVGRMGIVQSIVIILAAASISFITSLSLSAIATNTRVKGGGPYFLVSRTLGAQFGATLGIVFYCAQAIAVALYIVGFSEAFVRAFGLSSHQLVLVATVVNALLFISVFIGAKWTMHVQYLFLVLVVLSLISFFWGALTLWDNSQLQNNLAAVTSDYRHFIVMFALFFPAVSGMTAGANLSGDLKNPSRAIPLGTLSAVILTTLVYLAMAVSLAASCPRDVLLENNFAVSYAARSEILITLGIFGATLSSAVGC